MPALASTAVSSSAILLPEKIPVRIPIRVIPIWMADRNLSGSDASFKAVLADFWPLSASVCRLDFLAEISAISDIEKTPFSRISAKMMTISSINPPFLDCKAYLPA